MTRPEDKAKLFDEAYRHYRKQMIAVAKSILKNDEDAVHDVFCCIAYNLITSECLFADK